MTHLADDRTDRVPYCILDQTFHCRIRDYDAMLAWRTADPEERRDVLALLRAALRARECRDWGTGALAAALEVLGE